MSINYKYNEAEIIERLKKYVDTTYIADDNNHYARGKIESSEYIIDQGHGLGFFLGNVIKYTSRYGKKGGANKKDLFKVLHYAIMAIYTEELEESKLEKDQEERPRESDGCKLGESDFTFAAYGRKADN